MFDTAPRLIDLHSRTHCVAQGEDNLSFLQGQLTQDVHQLTPQNFLWAALCSSKGRVLATLLLWRQGAEIYIDAPHGMSERLLSRLRPYILRSRVTLLDLRPTHTTFGLVGANLDSQSLHWLPDLPAVGQHDDWHGITRLRLSAHRVLLSGPTAQMEFLRPHLSATTLPPADPWGLAAVREGLAEVTPDSAELFIPQWLNWDLIGGISFKKGCYTGQEIVARTHYLGQSKRRTLRFLSQHPHPVGTSVLRAGEKVGEICACVANEQSQHELLAVVHLDAAAEPTYEAGTPTTEPLLVAPLPYAFPA
ncbi:MAG: folate-binding protein YgfZ [Ferrovum sp.]|nr:folate-binding protein YgfZ [Ferrovum sp.]NDU86961.1 folate-binding protein YgfZ [Ferrovum sp.]